MDEPPKERRGATRVDVELWVEESSEPYFQRCKNLSEGGLFLDRAIPLPIGTVVHLRFALPDAAAPIEASGEIVNAESEGLGMGIRFVDLSPEARARIGRFVGEQKAK